MAGRGRKNWLTLAVLAGSGMLTSLQFTLIVPALPEIPAALSVNANDASWVFTVTLLTGTVGSPILARLADMYGRRRLLLVSLALLVAGSVIAALGMTFVTVLIGRALQGFSSAIVPIGISLLRASTSRERSNMGIALMSATLGIGSALGLPLSGVLSTMGGLASLFWFSAVAGTIFFVLIIALVKEAAIRAPGRFDFGGALLLTIALSSILLLVSKAAVWGLTSPAVIGLAVVGTVTLVAWFPLQLRHPSPVVDVRRSLSRAVLQTNIASFFVAFTMFANYLLTIQEARAPLVDGGLGIPMLGAGLILLPSASGMILLAPAAGKLLNKRGGRFTLAFGSAIIASAYIFRLLVNEGMVAVVVGSTLVGIGTAFAFAAMPALIMDAVPADEASSANGVNSMVRSLSGATASAAFALLIVLYPAGSGGDFLSTVGLTAAFAIVTAFALTSTVLAVLLPRPGGMRH